MNKTLPQASFVGFDSIINELNSLVARTDPYPPCNILKLPDNQIIIELAVAGFNKEDLSVSVLHNILTVEGSKEHYPKIDEDSYQHKGISSRSFARSYRINENVEIKGTNLENGILSIHLYVNLPKETEPTYFNIG